MTVSRESTQVKEACCRTCGGCQAARYLLTSARDCLFVHLFVHDPVECGSLLVRSFIRSIFNSLFRRFGEQPTRMQKISWCRGELNRFDGSRVHDGSGRESHRVVRRNRNIIRTNFTNATMVLNRIRSKRLNGPPGSDFAKITSLLVTSRRRAREETRTCQSPFLNYL